jgi:hypothetical protein
MILRLWPMILRSLPMTDLPASSYGGRAASGLLCPALEPGLSGSDGMKSDAELRVSMKTPGLMVSVKGRLGSCGESAPAAVPGEGPTRDIHSLR